MSHSNTDPAVLRLPRRDLASSDLWERSLERSLYRREQAEYGRRNVTRKKGASVAMSAAMLGATAAPSVVAAQTGGGSGSGGSGQVAPTALEDPGDSILLQLGDSGPDVAAVQRELATVQVDGLFGSETQSAVMDFQQANGLRVDGVVGHETWRALFSGKNVAFLPQGPAAVQPAVATERPAPPTKPASLGSSAGGVDGSAAGSSTGNADSPASNYNGGNFVVMVQNDGSSGDSGESSGSAASASAGRSSAGKSGGGATAGGKSSSGGGAFAGGRSGNGPGGAPSGNGSSGGGGSAGGGGGNAGGGGGNAGGGGGGHAGGVTVCGLNSLKWPVAGRTIYGDFGEDRGTHSHAGIDISYAGIDGDPVRAAACGRISFAGVQSGYGNIVCVKHTAKFETCYAHLSSIRFRSGYVKTGQMIGRVGSTGFSTGPHLHFETRVNGSPQDPIPYLRGSKKVPGENKRYERSQRRAERQEQREREAREAERQSNQPESGEDTQTASTGVGGRHRMSTQTTERTSRDRQASEPVQEEAVAPAPEPAPVEPAPAPEPVEPVPAPEPVEPAPAPEPAPVQEAAAPELVEPAPEPVEPAPAPEPAPVEPAPAPETAPEPVEPAPAPAPAPEPEPVEPAPAPEPEAAAPAPAPEPAPVEPVPAPEPVEPAPVPEAEAPAPVEPAPETEPVVPEEEVVAPQ